MKLESSMMSLAVAGLMFAGGAVAGSKYLGSGAVVITRAADGSGTVSGYLGLIYNGSGKSEYIGCEKYGDNSVYCHAVNEAKDFAYCQGSAFLGKTIGNLSSDAKLTFGFDASGRCTSVSITHSSEIQDKHG
jgi:hypothetical protein